jgi:26S proteasome regulatory subunit N8
MATLTTNLATEVVIHPLVLLSVTDHYNRVAKDTRKRVIGVLLGSRNRNQVDVTNSFAVPFEEDLSNPTVWFLDHNFLETMFWMFKKVNSESTFQSQTTRNAANDLFVSR